MSPTCCRTAASTPTATTGRARTSQNTPSCPSSITMDRVAASTIGGSYARVIESSRSKREGGIVSYLSRIMPRSSRNGRAHSIDCGLGRYLMKKVRILGERLVFRPT